MKWFRSHLPVLAMLSLVFALGTLTAGAIGLNTRQGDLEKITDDLTHFARQLQQSRYDAVLRNCRLRNEQSLALIAFVKDVSPDLVAVARGRFPVEPDCRRYARQQIQIKNPPRFIGPHPAILYVSR